MKLSRFSACPAYTARIIRPVLFPGIPSSSDLAMLDMQPWTTPWSPMKEEDARDLRELHANLERICVCAREGRIKSVIDAKNMYFRHSS
ncbi:hypothetical protein EDC04DRAFT_2805251 [Pisolithus marmoratus]|nr:hypothetical protein EDC04DRAFT_2805251 [Pisolithus marmoratus]